MRCYLISDNIDTKMGMRLAGIQGTVLHEHDEILAELKNAIHNPEIAVVMLTEKAAEPIQEELRILKMTVATPLLVVIPDRHGTADMTAAISRYLEETVGIHI